MKTFDSSSNQKFFLFLLIIIGLIAVFPQTFYQPFLLQGDHGRDIYIFQQTAHGAVPYRDYKTDNGPFMPYYYGAFLSYFGETIQSVLNGYAILIFLAGFLIFLIARKSIPPSMALLCALWYWAWRGTEFFYTFNHIGAIVAGLATILFTITSINQQKKRYFVFGIVSSVVCMFIRPDIGIAALFGLLISCFIYQQKEYLPHRPFFIFLLTFLGGMIVMTNIFIPQIFSPYWHSIHIELILQNIVALMRLWFFLMTQNLFTIGLSLLIGSICLAGLIHLWKTRSEEGSQKILRSLVCFSIFFILFLMEFLVGNRFFRWVWVFPILVLMIFHLLYGGLTKLTTLLRLCTYSLFLIVCATLLLFPFSEISASKQHKTVLKVGASKIWLSPGQKPWIKTVQMTSAFIKKLTKPKEPILTLPYDALYCFLTKRPLAVPDPGLFHITDRAMIPLIEQKRVRLIVISNRAFRPMEPGRFGVFGQTYGKGLWKYIQDHYQLVAQIGPWDHTTTPILNHATRIYLRKTPFSQVKGEIVKGGM